MLGGIKNWFQRLFFKDRKKAYLKKLKRRPKPIAGKLPQGMIVPPIQGKANDYTFIENLKDDFVKSALVEKKKALLIGLGSSNGFDTSIFRKPTDNERIDAKNYFKVDQATKVISYVGRLAPDKGADDLFKVYSG